MKQLILILSFLFVTTSVMISPKENTCFNKAKESLTGAFSCFHSADGYPVTTCSETPAAEKKNDAGYSAAEDYELPLFPISRFILTQ